MATAARLVGMTMAKDFLKRALRRESEAARAKDKFSRYQFFALCGELSDTGRKARRCWIIQQSSLKPITCAERLRATRAPGEAVRHITRAGRFRFLT